MAKFIIDFSSAQLFLCWFCSCCFCTLYFACLLFTFLSLFIRSLFFFLRSLSSVWICRYFFWFNAYHRKLYNNVHVYIPWCLSSSLSIEFPSRKWTKMISLADPFFYLHCSLLLFCLLNERLCTQSRKKNKVQRLILLVFSTHLSYNTGKKKEKLFAFEIFPLIELSCILLTHFYTVQWA